MLARASIEPVAVLYEQGRVHHVGSFTELEDELCTYVGGGDSPDRLDAMVYALSDLMCGYQAQAVSTALPIFISQPRHNPFVVGPNPFTDAGASADMERCYGDQRNEGFSIKGF
jgi:hypothetical protein